MQTVVRKWGNSLALRLPQHLAADLHFIEGATVTLTIENGSLVVKAARKRYRLADLLAQMDEKKQHQEVDWGRAEGEEAW
jgi:antitoxin MazE